MPAELILSLAGCAATPAPPRIGTSGFVVQSAKPWLPRYDPKTDWNFTHTSEWTQQTCLRSAALPIPKADLPTTAQGRQLTSCNSEALYYGFAGKPNYVRARKCAYLERAAGNRFPIASSAVLAMIYANGLGVTRNLPLATKFACEAGGAPAEINGRVGHLEDLAKNIGTQPRPRFDFCDDMTSGHMEGICAGVAATYRDARRWKAIAHVASSYTPPQREALSALRGAAADYFNAHAKNEVDLSGTARGAFWIEDIQNSWDRFLRDLLALEADTLPMADAATTRQADARLNRTLHRVLAGPLRQRPPPGFPPPGIPVVGGTISRQGIRVDQGLWRSYRDAWLHFAALRKPALPRSTVQAWITNQRIRNLRCLLPFGRPGARDCTRPTLLPSNMRPWNQPASEAKPGQITRAARQPGPRKRNS